MLRNLFGNIQPVVKNLLIINALFFLATIVLQNKDISLIGELGLFYPDSPHFQPYQLATHFFMHDGFRHVLFNMIALVVFGNMLEQVWGQKKFLIFFFATALGAALIHLTSEAIQIYQITGDFFPIGNEINVGNISRADKAHVEQLIGGPAVGASGAIYGLIVGTAMLFPNKELHLYGVIPIKIKWLAALAIGYDVISLYQDSPTDHTAHFAHLGGALIGFAMVYFWKKKGTNFY
jgi:membrane associated rhomboid family serine protease